MDTATLCQLKDRLLVVAVLCIALYSPNAISATWVGGTTNWATASNWNPASVPLTTTDVIINTATGPTVSTAGAVSKDIFLSSSANSNFTVSGGGTLTSSGYGYIGFVSGLTGTVFVDGAGSLWRMQNIQVGWQGTGNLTISNGATVASDSWGTIGYPVNSTGTATITGAGSKMTSVNDLVLSGSGRGTLYILNGGSYLSSAYSYLGFSPGSTGALTVDGADSNLTSSGTVHIGFSGNGTATVSNGGKITSNSWFSLAYYNTSTGAVTVTGAGSQITTVNGMLIGNSGTGTFNVLDGGSFVGSSSALIGANSGSTGTLTVDGSGSSFSVSGITYVGNSGKGFVAISNGGTFTDNSWFTIAYETGSTGTVTITGAGSKITSSETLIIANKGTGSLNILNGGSYVSYKDTRMASGVNSTAYLTVSGTNSNVTNTYDFYAGYDGNGTATVSNGGSITSGGASYIGFNAGSTGALTITGTGSDVTSTGSLVVGYSGTGSLSILNGGTYHSNNNAHLGYSAGKIGSATVDGSGSGLTTVNTLYVGRSGTGSLTISNGGSVQGATAYVGYNAGSGGTVNLSGSGSTLTTSGDLYIGNSSSGVVTISDAGSLAVSGVLNIAKNAGSTGALNIGAAFGGSATSAGSVDADTITFGAGTGMLVFNHTDDAYTFASDITGSGTIKATSGMTELTGDLSAFTGSMSITGSGELKIDGTTGGTVEVGSGGRLQGNNTIGGATLNSGATIAPGNSIGTINVAGNITFNSGSTYEVEINSQGQSDKIVATGAATINGGDVSLLAEVGNNYSAGTSYTILTAAGGVAGTFDSVSLDMTSIFLEPQLSYDATNVYARVVRNSTSFASAGRTANERTVASAIESLGAGNGLFDAVAMQTSASNAAKALRFLNGEVYSYITDSTFEDVDLISQIVLERMFRSRDITPQSKASLIPALYMQSSSLQEQKGEGSSVWAQGYGDWSVRDGGASEFKRRTSGILMGMDRDVGRYSSIGTSVNYSKSSYSFPEDNRYNSNYSKGTADKYGLFVYGDYKPVSMNLSGGFGYMWADVQTDRRVSFSGFSDTLSDSYNIHSLSSFVEAGVPTSMTVKTELEPFVGINYDYLIVPQHKESGGDAALTTKSDGAGLGQTIAGIKVRHSMEMAEKPEGNDNAMLSTMLGWKHKIGDTSYETKLNFDTSNAFKAESTSLTRDDFVASVGLDLKPSESLSMSLSYTSAPFSDSHSVRGGLSCRF